MLHCLFTSQDWQWTTSMSVFTGQMRSSQSLEVFVWMAQIPLRLSLASKTVEFSGLKKSSHLWQKKNNSASFKSLPMWKCFALSSLPDLAHPFSIDVFEDYIYGVTLINNFVFRVNKFGKGPMETLTTGINHATDIVLYHRYKQPEGECRRWCHC